LQEGETITNIMAMPDDEDTWDNLNMMFSTASGNIRRSDMSDFKLVQSNGKIAIRLEDGDSLVAVQPAANEDHVLLASHNGKCIRFQIESLRVIKSRTSIGVRGINLEKGDKVISMAIINGIEATTEERDAYLRIPLEQRLAIATFMESENDSEANDIIGNLDGCLLEPADIKKFADHEEFLLTVTENGYGKRSSLYEYRITNRGGKGIVNIITSPRNGNVAANFPVKETDQIMLMTGQGKIIRCPVGGIRIAGRNTQGVTIFKTAEKERVVSASLIADSSNNDEDGSENENSNDDAA
jgi:DNA gyrase subunit A